MTINHFRSIKLIRATVPVLALALLASLPATPQGKGKGGGGSPSVEISR